MSNKLFVWNLSWNITWKELKDIFADYGEVAFSRVVTDKETGKSRGFGFVEFTNETDAKKAFDALDWAEVDWRVIRVDFATDKPRE